MRNLSIVTQIAIINIFVFTIFISIFIYKNYAIVSNQFVLLQNEKIDSIIKTISPVISINLTLGLENNIKEIVNDSIKLHKELVGIEVTNSNNQIVYKNINSDIKDLKIYHTILEDTILKSKLGELKVFYTFSSIYSKLLTEFYQFLIFIAIFFIFSTYVYELPTHQCPFCMLQKEYHFIGYFIWSTLFLGTFFGVASYILKVFINEDLNYTYKYSLIFNTIFVFICSFYVIRYYLINGVFL